LAIGLPVLPSTEAISVLIRKQDEAIALARRNNIVCEGSAFIAWDETEKVSVSSRELYQPAFDLTDIELFGTVADASFGATREMIGARYMRGRQEDLARHRRSAN
jgi:hypothetical protein